MSRRAPVCHVGVAFYTVPNFSTQWTFVLSESPLFEGFVWCGTVTETVNGFGASWAMCNSSLTTINPMAMFLGVIHVAQSSTSISTTKSLISLENIASEINRSPVLYPNGSENYVILALLRLCEGGSIRLIDEKPQSISNSIRSRLPDLQRARPQASKTYPVISLDHTKASRT
ncbi:hypothetical protein BJV78DRAFT_1246555 [Lactifluus subvellereus]|nr:hypothetical protein BJV78DRAFT_1246555 [Lactifluus subvellereus]